MWELDEEFSSREERGRAYTRQDLKEFFSE